ncbi:TerB family tellurite resistance protein [Ideonella sp. B508-1]|uniref:tellurite resistance TerB family protein n=1 Tax=Ideonella sp. B508-1 TaxID=137716 RepID=UPI00034543D8|nr:TerB family tellurite resistance protein [Ideonella sp. B508-1]
MRSYPRNSPEAGARLLALVLISDGHVCRSEIETLQRLQVEEALGLAPGRFAQVMHTLCDDLLASAYGSGALMCHVDEATLASLLSEVDDPLLQAKVMQLARDLAQADRHLAEAEAQVLSAAHRQWRIPGAALANPGAATPWQPA